MEPTHETLPLDLVDRPEAPTRQTIDADYIEILAASIRDNGQLQPIGVVPNGPRYTVVYGDCRWHALHRLGAPTVRAYVYASSAEAMLHAQLAENADRADVNPVDEAVWFAQLWDALQCGTDELAAKLHKEIDYVERRLNLLTGDAGVRDALHAGKIGVGVAELLNKFEDEDGRRSMLDAAAAGGASKRLVQQWIAERRAWAAARGGAPAIDVTMPAANQEADPPPPITCVYCEGTEEVYLMVQLWIHKPCWNMLRKLLLRHVGGEHAVQVVEAGRAR